MNIAIIGAGNVGGALGTRWAQKGHKITFGLRKPDDPKFRELLKNAGPNARAATIAESVKDAEVVVLATPWDAARDAVKSAGDLKGKIVVDCTNPIAFSGGKITGLSVGHTTSAAEQVASWAPGARVVKAFNTTGAGNMTNPSFGSQNASMFICGDDAQAKAAVKKLSDDLGFDTIDAGALSSARYLEPVAMLWIHMAIDLGWGPNFAFKTLKR